MGDKENNDIIARGSLDDDKKICHAKTTKITT